MDKSIIRTVKNAENPFVMIDRRIFENDGLSLKAKGLLGYLLSRPDNWTICMADLVKRTKDGKDSVNSALDELIESGYVVKTEQQRESGKFSTCEYVVYEQPVLKTRDGETDAEKPQRKNRDGKSATNNNDLNNKEYNESESAPAQNSESENLNAIEVFEFLKKSSVFGSELGIIQHREPNISELNVLIAEVTGYWSGKYLSKQQLLTKILSSVSRKNAQSRIDTYTMPKQQATTDSPVFDEVALKTDPKVLTMIAAKRKGGSHGTA